MNTEEYAVMAGVEENHWWYRGLRDAIQKTLLTGPLRLPKAPRILDAGCGTGRNLELYRRAFAPSYLGGFDLSEQALEFAAQKAHADDLYRSDICDPDVREADLDLITSLDVIYIPGAERALAGLRRLVAHLARGGLFLLNVPAYNWLHSEHDVAVHTSQRFTVPEIRQLFMDIGLDPVLLTYRLCFLFPAMAASRLLGKSRVRTQEVVRSDLQRPPGALVNGFLERVLCFENDLIAQGVSFAFGGSVFAIGRKP